MSFSLAVKRLINQCESDWESMKRGAYAGFLPLIPLAIMAAAKIGKSVMNARGKISAAKEQKKAEDANLQADFEQRQVGESNKEDDRLARMEQVGGQLTGARALSPKVIAAALKRRASSVRKGATADQSKGVGWQMAGDITGHIGDFAGAYAKGGMMGGGGGGAEATSLRPSIGNSPVSMGGQTFDFSPKKDLY